MDRVITVAMDAGLTVVTRMAEELADGETVSSGKSLVSFAEEMGASLTAKIKEDVAGVLRSLLILKEGIEVGASVRGEAEPMGKV